MAPFIALMGEYTGADTIAGPENVHRFMERFAAALSADFSTAKAEAIQEAALQGGLLTPALTPSPRTLELFSHKSRKPRVFSGDGSSGTIYPQWRQEVM